MESFLKSWKAVSWENVQIRVDEEIKAIGVRQDEGDVGRKILVDESNKYREVTTKETRRVALPLIKAFQKEVDQLTVRGKATEAALIEICSQLTNLPDPTPIIEQAIVWKLQAEKADTAIEEANHLRAQVAQAHTELADLRNQDVTIRQLRETVKQLEEEKTREVEKAVVVIEKDLRTEFSIRDHETTMRSDKLKAENAALEKKVSELEALMRDAQRRLDVARVAADRKEALENEQIDILSRDLNDANRRVAHLEAELNRVREELADVRASSKRGGLEDIAVLGGLMKEKDEQIARLTEENQRLVEAAAADASKARLRCDELATELEKRTHQIKQLEALLADKSDYEAIKKELRLLREIEFGEAATANEESIARLGETVQSLDRLLAAKNRRLQNDNAQLRQTNERYQEQLAKNDVELAQLRQQTTTQTELIAKLEADLAAAVARRNSQNVDELSTIDMLGAVHDPKMEGDARNVLTIVLAQRDRLKLRVGVLEEELMAEKSKQTMLQTEIEKVRDDNVKLYGKIKFLQSSGNKPAETSVPLPEESSYSAQYERRLDPFQRFGQAETQRGYARLPIHDRASLSIGRAIMTSASARMTFFFYLVILHLLVFLVLYRFAYTESCERDFQQDCVARFERHMREHHPGISNG
uniref:Protein CASP n=1 Tax=Haemonchus contortus TaxID=6289 RepID=A0A7I4Z731_HAECO